LKTIRLEETTMLLSQELLLDLEASRLLTRLDGKPKSDLQEGSEKLLAEIEAACAPTGNCSPVNIVGFHNLGALFLFYAGEFERAEEVCRHAIGLCQMLAEEDTFARWAAHMLQPYLNLGRIAAATAKRDESLAIFREVFQFVQRQNDLVMEGYRIPACRFDELLGEDSTLGLVGAGVYVGDSIRAFLSAEDFEGLLLFAETAQEDPLFSRDSFPYTLMEAKARALLELQRPQDALNTLVTFVQRMSRDTVRYGAIYTLIADIYRRSGIARDANKMLEMAETYMRAVWTKSGFCPELLRTTHLIALQHLLLGQLDRAALNAQLALETARNLGDEAGRLKTLVVLLNSLSPTQSASGTGAENFEALCEELELLTRQTGYRYEKALGYVQLADTGIGAGAGTAGLHQAHAILENLRRSCRGKRQQKISTYISSIEQAAGNGAEPDEPAQCDHLSKLYDKLMGLQPSQIMQLAAAA
jgi:tetratricopeptide (TPR) repeat protein